MPLPTDWKADLSNMLQMKLISAGTNGYFMSPEDGTDSLSFLCSATRILLMIIRKYCCNR